MGSRAELENSVIELDWIYLSKSKSNFIFRVVQAISVGPEQQLDGLDGPV